MDNIRFKQWFAFFIIFIFNKFPIKHNKILFFSYYGAQFGCNPKYISNYIDGHYQKGTFDVVWAFYDPESKQTCPFRKVKMMSLRYFYDLCTSKIIVTNYRTTNFFVKRKGQYYIQTWHSSLRLKNIEKDAEAVLPKSYITMAQNDSLKCDLLLSGCQFSTKIFENSFWYQGEIFQYGTPRNDILLENNHQLRENTLQRLKVPHGTKVVLYAPTFRKDSKLQMEGLEYENLINALTKRFGGKWMVLVKLHPHHLSESKKLAISDHVINVTDYDDIQELLVTADILISDYSSLIFDFAITRRPCFLYVPDLEDYTTNERGLYFDVDALPFIDATSNIDLLAKINSFSEREYKKEVAAFLQDIGSYEQGKACEFLLEQMEQVCFHDGRSEIDEAV